MYGSKQNQQNAVKGVKAMRTKAEKIASRATFDNPISIMKLGELTGTVLLALTQGASDEEAEAKGVEFIKSLN